MATSLRFLGKIHSISRGPGGMRLPSVLGVRREAFQKSRQLVARRFTSSSKDKAEESAEKMTMLQRFLAPKPMPERNTPAWYREVLLICTVFGITGSSTMMVSDDSSQSLARGPAPCHACSHFSRMFLFFPTGYSWFVQLSEMYWVLKEVFETARGRTASAILF